MVDPSLHWDTHVIHCFLLVVFCHAEIDLVASSNSLPGELSASDSSFTSEASARSESLTLPEADLSPIFIVVQVLEQGQYFVS